VAGTPEQPSYFPDHHSPWLESEMAAEDDGTDDGTDEPAARRRLPAWLLPSLAALVVGVLIGSFLFGGSDAATARATAVPADASGQPAPGLAPSLTRSEPVQVDIPAIEVSSSLVDLGLNDDGTLEVPVNYDKAGWFTGGTYPGEPQGRPGLIAGHVDDGDGPAVFYRLTDLSPGDEVLVTRADNTVAVFRVEETQQFPKSQLPTDRIYAPVSSSEIVLITCTGDYDEKARSYEDNLVVRAVLDMERSVQETEKRKAAGAPAPAGDLPNV
jgi:sortase (surface protein transpeptidase)